MRIWQLCTPRELYSTQTGGAVATVVAELTRELSSRGHDVTVAARVDGTTLHESGGSFVSLGRVPWPTSPSATIRWKAESALNRAAGWTWPAYASYLAALRRQLRRARALPEVVVAHNDPMVIRYLRRWTPDATLVLWMHNVPYRPGRHRGSADRPDVVVTVSDYLGGEAADRLGVSRQDVVTIHNGVDSTAFHPRDGFDRPTTPLRVLCLGRLDVNKGADTALTAVTGLQADGVPIELTVVGSPWFSPTPGVAQDPWGERFVARLAAAGAVHIAHVPRDQVTALVRERDVVCVLSRWDDPFPLVVLEAMASGCAVVATDRGGIPEAAGGVARLVESDDPAAVSAVLREWVEDPASLAGAKRAGRARAVSCTWHRAAGELLDAIGPTGPAARR